MAFPVAHVINNIVNNHEPFFKIFIGRLYKKCIYLVPRYINKTKVFFFSNNYNYYYLLNIF